MRKRVWWIVGIGLFLLVGAIALFVASARLSKRFEPFIREQAIRYMQERFRSEVELAALRIRMPKTSPLRLLLRRGQSGVARVEGEGLSMHFGGDRELPPLFSIRKFSFDVDLGTLFDGPRVVPLVSLEGVQIHIPPKGRRPSLSGAGETPNVRIRDVRIRDALLVILPKDKKKTPLEFAIERLRLTAADEAAAMNYDAGLTNPKPPGHIQSKGTFGPWSANEPGDTPLAGQYTFKDADLGVFPGIAGHLRSSGVFDGTLDSIHARGEASVANFRLKTAGNPVPLWTRFEVLVDGTNGNTILQPVEATLGKTRFTTAGGVIRHEANQRRAISLHVSMPKGDLRDLLRLAMKGPPFMEGIVALQTKIDIPPLLGRVREKLVLDGRFQVTEGKFVRSNIQEQVDNLSRRGQGQPKNEKIDEVVSNMKGVFHLEDEALTFHSFSFAVPGADVALVGVYNLDADTVDFRGNLKLKAKVSQTMTGWKRWALKPVDPFFAKEGAGTFLRIKVDGSSREPKFGLDRGRKAQEVRGQ